MKQAVHRARRPSRRVRDGPGRLRAGDETFRGRLIALQRMRVHTCFFSEQRAKEAGWQVESDLDVLKALVGLATDMYRVHTHFVPQKGLPRAGYCLLWRGGAESAPRVTPVANSKHADLRALPGYSCYRLCYKERCIRNSVSQRQLRQCPWTIQASSLP